MQVEVVSKEMIKPSSSTPLHLQHYKLSLLDQFAPPSYIRFVLFYTSIPNQQNIQKFKNSLADSLTLYYPLAGKYIKDRSLIHCNDDGALFIEARVEGDVEDSDIQLEALLPAGHDLSESKDEVLMAIQATHFTNGISVGICATHKIVDGAGVAAFIKCWGAQATGKEFDPPTFEASNIWPPMENPPANLQIASDNRSKGEMVMKKILFSAKDIANLKEKAKGKDTRPPSRVVAVMALLWRCLMLSSKKTKEISLPNVMGFPVNLRPRIVPLLGESSFGSINKTAMVLANPDEQDLRIDELASRIRAAARKVDDGYARNRALFHGVVMMHEPFTREIFGKLGGAKMESCVVTSWCDFGLDKANLGWGSPEQVRCVPTVSNKNFALLTDAKDGDGIEVLLNMGFEEMETFQKLPDLLAFTSLIH